LPEGSDPHPITMCFIAYSRPAVNSTAGCDKFSIAREPANKIPALVKRISDLMALRQDPSSAWCAHFVMLGKSRSPRLLHLPRDIHVQAVEKCIIDRIVCR